MTAKAQTVAQTLKNLLHPQKQTADLGLLRLYGLIRIVVAYCVLHTITFGHVLVAPLYYPDSFWTPQGMAFALPGPPEAGYLQALIVLSLMSTLMLGLGLFTRYSGPLCFVSTCLLSLISFSYGRLNHNTNTVFLMLFIFSFSDWGHCFSLDALIRRRKNRPAQLMTNLNPEWPIALTLATFALPYFTTSFFKILKGHFVEPGYISHLVKYKQLFWELHGTIPPVVRAVQNWTIDHSGFMDILAVLTLIIEIGFCLALLGRTARVAVLALALILHSSITLTTKIYFLEHMYILAILLLATLALLLRDRLGWMARLFPFSKAPDTQPQPEGRPLWIKSLWAYGLSVVVVFGMPWLPLPAMDAPQWVGLMHLRDSVPLFATNTYLFGYVSDIAIGAVLWVLCATVLAGLALYAMGWLVRAGRREPLPPPPGVERVVIYDGDCGFCQRWVNWAISCGAEPGVRFRAWQRHPALVEELGLSPEDCTRYAWFVHRVNGSPVLVCKGAQAINQVLCLLPGRENRWYRLIGQLYQVDGIRQLQNLGYRIIANNRHRLGGGACRIDAASA